MRSALLALPALLLLSASGADATPAPLPADALPAAHSHERVQLSPDEEEAWLDQVVQHSPHRRALETAKLVFGDTYDAPPLPAIAQGSWLYAATPKAYPAKKGRRLYGYLPYWTMTGTTLHWGELTQLSYFGAELSSAGVFTNLHGWGGTAAKALIAKAHKNGVQVPLTVTLFSKSGIHAVLATAAKRTALTKKIIDLVISGGGDGVNIDFEGMAKEDKAAMNAFINELNTKMKQQLPGADVTLATPAVDWTGAWDYDYLAEHSDGLMVMAYGLHWSGGPPGPNLPMGTGGPWNHKTLPWVIDDYVKYGKAANKHKFIIGLPLYGHAWKSSSGVPGAASLGKATSVTYEKGIVEAPTKGGWKWDAVSQSSYYVYKASGTWMQAWTDTAAAFDIRVKYLDKRGTQMGLWALGYADKSTPVWKSIAWFMAQGKPTGGGTDAGATDAGSPDAGGADTGAADTAAKDSGVSDTGVSDTGAPDSGVPDSGPGPSDGAAADASLKFDSENNNDAGEPDTTQPDAAKAVDATSDVGGARFADVSGRPQADIAAPDGNAGAPQDGGGAALDGVTGQDAADTGLAPTTSFAPTPDSGCSAQRSGLPADGSAPMALAIALMAGLLLRRRRAAA